MVLLHQHVKSKEIYLSELLEQRQLKDQCSEVLAEPHQGCIWSDPNSMWRVCIEITAVLHRFRAVRVSPGRRIGHFLPRCSPDASSVLDINPRPEFILKHYIFSLIGVSLRIVFETWFVG